MDFAVSQICTLRADFETEVMEYASANCRTMELWLGKIESYLADHVVSQVSELLSRHNLRAPVASYQGGLFTPPGEAWQAHWEHFNRRLDLCRQLDVKTMVLAGDIPAGATPGDFGRVVAILKQAAEAAADHGVRLALEFQADSQFPNNLASAIALVENVDHAALGLCLDTFHFLIGPSKTEDLAMLNGAKLFHVQVADLSGEPREFATDSQRVLPGEGDFPWPAFAAALQAIGYQDAVSVEVMNPVMWTIPARQVVEVCLRSLQGVFGGAKSSSPRTG